MYIFKHGDVYSYTKAPMLWVHSTHTYPKIVTIPIPISGVNWNDKNSTWHNIITILFGH